MAKVPRYLNQVGPQGAMASVGGNVGGYNGDASALAGVGSTLNKAASVLAKTVAAKENEVAVREAVNVFQDQAREHRKTLLMATGQEATDGFKSFASDLAKISAKASGSLKPRQKRLYDGVVDTYMNRQKEWAMGQQVALLNARRIEGMQAESIGHLQDAISLVNEKGEWDTTALAAADHVWESNADAEFGPVGDDEKLIAARDLKRTQVRHAMYSEFLNHVNSIDPMKGQEFLDTYRDKFDATQLDDVQANQDKLTSDHRVRATAIRFAKEGTSPSEARVAMEEARADLTPDEQDAVVAELDSRLRMKRVDRDRQITTLVRENAGAVLGLSDKELLDFKADSTWPSEARQSLMGVRNQELANRGLAPQSRASYRVRDRANFCIKQGMSLTETRSYLEESEPDMTPGQRDAVVAEVDNYAKLVETDYLRGSRSDVREKAKEIVTLDDAALRAYKPESSLPMETRRALVGLWRDEVNRRASSGTGTGSGKKGMHPQFAQVYSDLRKMIASDPEAFVHLNLAPHFSKGVLPKDVYTKFVDIQGELLKSKTFSDKPPVTISKYIEDRTKGVPLFSADATGRGSRLKYELYEAFDMLLKQLPEDRRGSLHEWASIYDKLMEKKVFDVDEGWTPLSWGGDVDVYRFQLIGNPLRGRDSYDEGSLQRIYKAFRPVSLAGYRDDQVAWDAKQRTWVVTTALGRDTYTLDGRLLAQENTPIEPADEDDDPHTGELGGPGMLEQAGLMQSTSSKRTPTWPGEVSYELSYLLGDIQ